MRWVLVSLVVHAVVIAWLARGHGHEVVVWRLPALPLVADQHIESETMVDLIEEPAGGGGGGGGGRRTATAAARWQPDRDHDHDHDHDAWKQIIVRTEPGGQGHGQDDTDDNSNSNRNGNSNSNSSGNSNGNGSGSGNGNGIGFGAGGEIRVAHDVPTPPPSPAPSKARPAKLVWPTRDEDVDDDTNLFVARVTVGEDGSVVGARMVKTRPGARADRAADLIWQFRYAPALDDRGVAIRSTFEQPFQVR